MPTGTLRREKGQYLVEDSETGDRHWVSTKAFSLELAQTRAKARNGMAVDFEIDAATGRPARVRPAGAAWVANPEAEAQAAQAAEARDMQERARAQAARASAGAAGQASPPGGPAGADFHNPYNFVPFDPPRDPGHEHLGDTGQDGPVGHDRYADDRWVGRITVELACDTPLLLADPSSREHLAGDHPVFATRIGPDGRPLLAATSIKGALRSAYEAVTNSRMGVFDGHDKPLTFRPTAQSGATVIPACVEAAGGHLAVRLLPGTGAQQFDDRGKRLRASGAAWLPRYRGHPATYPDGTSPQHGDEVEAWLQLYRHQKPKDAVGRQAFLVWRARAVAPVGALGPAPVAHHNSVGNLHPVDGVPLRRVTGRVFVSGRNASNKHDERIFFDDTGTPGTPLPVEQDVMERWAAVIASYAPDAPLVKDDLQRSAHVNPGNAARRTLEPGALAYAVIDARTGRLTDLLPVAISRLPYGWSPRSLVPDEVLPAASLAQLSPADRVFGWAHPRGQGAYAGHVRVSNVRCLDDDALVDFSDEPDWDDGLATLEILGQPKQQQARFYAAVEPAGKPLPPHLPKRDAFGTGHGLRGRKFYAVHPHRPADYWARPTGAEEREHLRRTPVEAGEVRRSNQNRSFRSWVRPGARFRFDVVVDNLTGVELGALVWLLDLTHQQAKARLRLGGGKPLGFGTVTARVTGAALCTSQDRRNWYREPDPAGRPVAEATGDALADLLHKPVEAFKQAVESAAERPLGRRLPFAHVPHVAAFLRASTGYGDDLPVHYPRLTPGRDVEESSIYEWFMANERRPPHASLPALADGDGLPHQPG